MTDDKVGSIAAFDDMTDDYLVAEYEKLFAALENATDYRDALAYGLAIYAMRGVMRERGITYSHAQTRKEEHVPDA